MTGCPRPSESYTRSIILVLWLVTTVNYELPARSTQRRPNASATRSARAVLRGYHSILGGRRSRFRGRAITFASSANYRRRSLR